jgi:hypothetical protein
MSTIVTLPTCRVLVVIFIGKLLKAFENSKTLRRIRQTSISTCAKLSKIALCRLGLGRIKMKFSEEHKPI